jgi:hypothetical protein
LGNSCLNFQYYFKHRYEHEIQFANIIKEEIYEHAKIFLDNQNNMSKKYYNEFKKYEKEWYNALALAERVIILFN